MNRQPHANVFRVTAESKPEAEDKTTEQIRPRLGDDTVAVAVGSLNGESHHAGHAHLVFPNLLDTLRSLLSIIVISIFVLTFVVQPFRIPSESMERTLLVGDFLLVNKAVYGNPGIWHGLMPYQQVERGDVVVFHFPLDPSDHVVKRVVGVPGDHVRLVNGVVSVNGKQQPEPFAVFEGSPQDTFRDQFPARLYTDPGVDTHWWIEMRQHVQDGALVVPAGMYFVLGDNRNHSRDSRYWGFVPRANIVGFPILIYFSLQEPSATDANTLPDGKLGHEKGPLDTVMEFARWSRMFRVVH